DAARRAGRSGGGDAGGVLRDFQRSGIRGGRQQARARHQLAAQRQGAERAAHARLYQNAAPHRRAAAQDRCAVAVMMRCYGIAESLLCPLPSWERAARWIYTTNWVRGRCNASPDVSVERSVLPSPARGEGATTSAAFL